MITMNGSATEAENSSTRLYLLDYGAGNVRSLANALTELGYTYEWITCAEDFDKADVRTISSHYMSFNIVLLVCLSSIIAKW